MDAEIGLLDRFLARFPSEQGPPAQLVSRRRTINDARFDVAARGGQNSIARLVRAIGGLEKILARRDPGKEPQLPRPLGGLGTEWVEACGEAVEIRLAAAIASVGPTGGAGPFRTYVAPIEAEKMRRYAPAARALAWQGMDTADRLASVLERRMLDVRMRAREGQAAGRNPTWGSRVATLDDVAAFLAPGAIDDEMLEDLIFGFTWVDQTKSDQRAHQVRAEAPLPRDYALLKLLFLPRGIPRGDEYIRLVPHASILSLLRVGRISDAVTKASAQLTTKGFHARRVVEDGVIDTARGRRLAAALLIPVGQATSLVARALRPDMQTDNDEHEEMIDDR